MTAAAEYELPQGIVGLKGPIEKPVPGTLPLRGDLAHVALAKSYLAAHYVIPQLRTIGANPVTLKLQPRDDAPDGAAFESGERVELLDEAGVWAWVCRGPEGPSGYMKVGDLLPADSGT